MSRSKTFRVSVRFNSHQCGYQVEVNAQNPRQAESVAKAQEGADRANCCCEVY